MVKPYSGFNSFSPENERNADDFVGVEPEKLLLMLRTRAGLTQSEMGRLIGLSGRMIINWEDVYNLPRPEALRRVIELLLNRGVFTSFTPPALPRPSRGGRGWRRGGAR